MFSKKLPVIGFMKDGSVQTLLGPCKLQSIQDFWMDPESLSKIRLLGHFAFITHVTSGICLLIVLILHSFIKKLRTSPLGKYWIVFSIISIANYFYVMCLIGISVNFKSGDEPNHYRMYEYLSLTGLLFFEFAVYIWLLVICMEIFMYMR